MGSTIGFSTVQMYLDGIAALNGLIAGSPHGAFWQVDYDTFVDEDSIVPGVKCNGHDVPIIDKATPEQSPFYVILTNPKGWCSIERMPAGGPFIDDAVQFPLDDGSVVTGKTIREDLLAWLHNGYPKDPQPIVVTPA